MVQKVIKTIPISGDHTHKDTKLWFHNSIIKSWASMSFIKQKARKYCIQILSDMVHNKDATIACKEGMSEMLPASGGAFKGVALFAHKINAQHFFVCVTQQWDSIVKDYQVEIKDKAKNAPIFGWIQSIDEKSKNKSENLDHFHHRSSNVECAGILKGYTVWNYPSEKKPDIIDKFDKAKYGIMCLIRMLIEG